MFVRSTRLNAALSTMFVVALGACGNLGGCGACGAVQPLPQGGLPATQTIEGGAQIRVTQQGFNKLTAIIPGLLNSQLAGGFCVPSGGIGGSALGADYCYSTQGTCAPGCNVAVALNSAGTSVSVVGPQTLRVNVSATVSTALPIRGVVLGFSVGSCTVNVNSPGLGGSLDVALGIAPTTGELTLELKKINSFTLNLDISGCGILGDIADIAVDLVDDIVGSFIGEFIIDLLTPAISDIIQDFLPSPLGIAGMVDIGNVLEGVSPGTEGFLESRIVPGGYVRLETTTRGMSLGVITGMNADEDPSTRGGTRPDGVPLSSEPALCVPPMGVPAFGAPPHNLPLVAGRGTFGLAPAGAFDGMPDPAADIAMGLSETMLDLAGHHLVTSGAMCLGVGTSTINQLNVGTISLLVQSLGDVTSDTGNDPLLLVTRPQKAIDFTIGDNTAGSPAMTIHLRNMEVDFYAFLYERYVRAFTLDLTMNVGINLEFEQMPGQPAVIRPMLVGLSSSEVQLKVLNSEFVKESAAELEAVLPAVFDLVTPLLGNLGTINVPSFAGFALNNLTIKKVVTAQDEFLALTASLGSSAAMRVLGERDAFARTAVVAMDAQLAAPAPQSTGRARLREVVTPQPAQIRNSMLRREGGAMPTVTFDVDRFDERGREIEWSYNLNNGLWHPFTTSTIGGLVIRDAAFAWQGKYTIGLKSRIKGDYRTTSFETQTPVIIDSVGPKVATAKAAWDDEVLTVPVWDVVSEHVVEYAFGAPGSDVPATAWTTGAMARLSRAEVDAMVVNGDLAVFARDEAGNQTIAVVAPFHGTPGGDGSGCSCQTGGVPSGSGAALALLVGVALFGRPRRRLARVAHALRTHRVGRLVTTVGLWLGASAAISLAPGCSCGNTAAQACELTSDCSPELCQRGELPFCIDGECVCSFDIPPGKIGPYSDVATGPDGAIWVSAYAQTWGDLVVAKVEPGRVPVESWEWVDGVPDAPVTVPGSMIRGGIDASGLDVGMYTSIAVNPAGQPSVTYFDRETSSLKYAQKVNDVWQIHTIEAGTGRSLGESGELTGMYSSLTLNTTNGNPGVAYLAHIQDAMGARAEVRFAAAQTPNPTSAADWMFWTVDTAPLPPFDAANPNIYPLPEGLGLFVDSARLPSQAPVVVYYDRSNGDLKLSKFNTQTGTFGAARVLDGANVDAGWSPSVAVDGMGTVHVAYVGATADDLKYITDATGSTPEIIDDGYRIVGTTVDGLPKPEFHFVGEDASLQLVNGAAPMVVYQDATTQEMLMANRYSDGTWARIGIAGATDPWPGAYGFFASTALRSNDIVMSTWVINLPAANALDDNWVEVFTRPTGIQ